jgi:hypothetical protein
MMEAVRTSETSVNSHQSTRSYNPEGSHLHAILSSLRSYVLLLNLYACLLLRIFLC